MLLVAKILMQMTKKNLSNNTNNNTNSQIDF